MRTEIVIWGTLKGDKWEQILCENAGNRENAERIKKDAEQKGYEKIRFQYLDLSTPPNFINTIQA